MQPLPINLSKPKSTALCVIAVLCSGSAAADTLSSGVLTLNIDPAELAANFSLNTIAGIPSIYLEHYFDPATAAQLTDSQILNNDTPTNLLDWQANTILSNNLQFTVNGPSVAQFAGNQNQPTTFSFDPSDLTGSASGQIGLSGDLRFRLDVNPPTNRMITGDLTLGFDPTKEDQLPGLSGWTIYNNYSYNADAYDLFNVTTTLTGNELNLAGTLALGSGVVPMKGTQDAVIGSFTFDASVALPVPAAGKLFAGVLALAWLRSGLRSKTIG